MKKIKIYILLIIFFSTLMFVCFLGQEKNRQIFSIRKPSDIQNIFTGVDYYKKDMQVEYVTSYTIESKRNKINPSPFTNLHTLNTVFVFKIDDPKNLESVIKSIKLKKKDINIDSQNIGYHYDKGLLIFITVDGNVTDINNYYLDFTVKDIDSKKDVNFTKRYLMSNIDSVSNGINYLKAGEVSKFGKDSYVLTLTKNRRIEGIKYDDSMEFEQDLKIFNFGKNANFDMKKLAFKDKNGKNLDSKYKVSFRLLGSDSLLNLEPKYIHMKIKVNSTSEEEIEKINDIMKYGNIYYE